MLLLFFANGPVPPAGYVNASQVVNDIWPPLNARSAADAVFWTESEMYEWFNESARRLAGCGGVFVVRDTSITSVLSTPTYTLPDSHQATLQADLAGEVLRARNVQELEALDANWPATAGEPEAFLLDVDGTKTITLYPQPDSGNSGKTLGLIMRALAADVSATYGFLPAPPALAPYFHFALIAEARAKETRAQMPEISAWFKQLCGQYEQAVQGYLGGA